MGVGNTIATIPSFLSPKICAVLMVSCFYLKLTSFVCRTSRFTYRAHACVYDTQPAWDQIFYVAVGIAVVVGPGYFILCTASVVDGTDKISLKSAASTVKATVRMNSALGKVPTRTAGDKKAHKIE